MGTIFASFCPILVKIGPLTPRIMQEVSVPFGTRRQKSIYYTKYISKYWTEIHQLFSVGRIMYADYTRSSAMAEGLRDALVSIETKVPSLSCGIICVIYV